MLALTMVLSTYSVSVSAATTYSVSYMPGTYAKETDEYVQDGIEKNETITLLGETYTRTGYTHSGWSTNKNGTSRTYTLEKSQKIKKNLTLYPYWTVNKYTITFAGGEYGVGTPVVKEVNFGKDIASPSETFTREGYIQVGWTATVIEISTDAAGNEVFTPIEVTVGLNENIPNVTGDATYVPVWKNPYSTGECIWSLDGTVLTISGDGIMEDYSATSKAPWGTDITKVIITDGVTNIGSYAFSGCTNLASVEIGNSVEEIGFYAFSNCTRLASIIIPDSATNIGDYAFRGCKNLTSIEIGNSVEEIGFYAFSNCTRLASITIPDSVTSIGSYAFSGCTNLASVEIGNSLEEIGFYAFSNCTRLASIIIPDSVTSIGDYAFSGCTNLESVEISNSVKEIGFYAFSNCTRLASIIIPDSVTSIGDYAFSGCTNLESITISDSVTNIGENAFYNTSYYNNSTNWKNGVLYIGNHLIAAKDTLSGKYTIKSGTKTIATEGFYNCTSLTSINIPDSLTSIGSSAFSGCTGLTSLIISDSIINIGASAFYGCTNLVSVTISDSVVRIGMYAFYNCSNLKYVFCPDEAFSSNAKIIGSYNDSFLNAQWHYGASDHIPGEWVVDKEPTCVQEGRKSQVCIVCGFKTDITDVVATSNHSNGYDVVIVDDSIYTGEKIEPTIIVSFKGKVLKRNVNYLLKFENNVSCDDFAKVTVTGIGSYVDLNITKTFKVCKRDISNAIISVDNCVYNSYPQEPTVKVIDDGVVLKLNKDYVLDYINNALIGTATVKVIGINNCYGSVEKNFEITCDNRTITLEGSTTGANSALSYTVIMMGPGRLIGEVPCNKKFLFSYKITETSTERVIYSVETKTFGYYYLDYDFTNLASPTELKSYLIQYSWMDYDGNYYFGFISLHIYPSDTRQPDYFSISVLEGGSVKNDFLMTVTSNDEHFDSKTPGWTTSNSKIATVDNGTVTWHAPGSVTITASCCGWNRTVKLTKEICDLTVNGNIVTAGYFNGVQVPIVTYNGELLEEDVDYTLEVTDYGEYSIAKVVGKNLFKGTIFKKFYNDCGSPYICEHTLGPVNIIKESTCTLQGTQYGDCSSCGLRVYESVPMKEHVADDWTVVKGPTCTVTGTKHKCCTVCGEVFETATIPATGKHTASDWITSTKATVSAPGTKYKECTVCYEMLEIATIPQLKPTTPKVTTTNEIGGVNVTWNKVDGAVKYNVYRRQGGYSTWTFVGTTRGTTLLDKNVKSGIYYVYSVRAYNNVGQYSDFVTANTQTRKFMAVPQLASISNATNGLYITWKPVDGVTNGYRVYRRGAGSTYWTYLGTVKTTNFTDTSVKARSGEYFRYTVIADGGYHSKFDTTGLYLKRLANPTLTSTTSSTAGITVKWEAVMGTTGYYVYRKTASSTWVRVAAVGGTNNTSYLDKTAQKGTTYTYTVRAVYGATISSYNSGISCYDKY